jgi:integrase
MARGSITRVVSPITGSVSWRARFSYVDDAGVRRHRSKSFPTKKDAEAWLTRTLHELRAGIYIEPSTMTLAEHAERWFAQAAGRLRESTVYRYRQDWTLYIAPALGERAISTIRRSHVQALYDALTARGLAANTVCGVHRVLNGMMKAAVADELIGTNPCTGRTLPSTDAGNEIKFWTPDELDRFLAHVADKPTGPLWAFMAYTGCRVGEALALAWSDVDLEARTVLIHRTVRKDAHGRLFIGEGAKTASSNRVVMLPARAVLALHRQRAQVERLQAARPRMWRDEGLVFPNAYGGLKPPGNVHVTFAGYVREAKVPAISPHGLRHTAASLMYHAGVREKAAQLQLGHKTAAITINLYTHISEADRRAAADAIDALTRDDAEGTTTSGTEQA